MLYSTLNYFTVFVQGIIPDAESYGLLMESCGHRDMLVEALKLLEETSERGMMVAFIYTLLPPNPKP
jgi:pentatricopeptide repeat protein